MAYCFFVSGISTQLCYLNIGADQMHCLRDIRF